MEGVRGGGDEAFSPCGPLRVCGEGGGHAVHAVL